jgi:hypothetical protein
MSAVGGGTNEPRTNRKITSSGARVRICERSALMNMATVTFSGARNFFRSSLGRALLASRSTITGTLSGNCTRELVGEEEREREKVGVCEWESVVKKKKKKKNYWRKTHY